MRKEYDFTNGKKNQYIKSEVKKFLDTHRDVEFSAAKFEYSIYLYGEASQKAIEIANSRYPKTVADLELEKLILEVTEPVEVLKLMRKELSGSNRSILRNKIMEYENVLCHGQNRGRGRSFNGLCQASEERRASSFCSFGRATKV